MMILVEKLWQGSIKHIKFQGDKRGEFICHLAVARLLRPMVPQATILMKVQSFLDLRFDEGILSLSVQLHEHHGFLSFLRFRYDSGTTTFLVSKSTEKVDGIGTASYTRRPVLIFKILADIVGGTKPRACDHCYANCPYSNHAHAVPSELSVLSRVWWRSIQECREWYVLT
jgi:hypothetical protein